MAEDTMAERAEILLGADNTRLRAELALDLREDADEDPRACADAFVDAVRVGAVPVLEGADRSVARVDAERIVGRATVLDLALPKLPLPSLGILAHVLLHGPDRVERLRLESIAALGQPLTRLSSFDPFAVVDPPFAYAAVPAHRDELKYGALRVQFESDLPEAAGPPFEAAVRAWFRLVELRGFLLCSPRPSGRSEASSGLLKDAADAFPDEWVFSYQFLRVDEHACRPLLGYLVELHAAHPILEVAFE